MTILTLKCFFIQPIFDWKEDEKRDFYYKIRNQNT